MNGRWPSVGTDRDDAKINSVVVRERAVPSPLEHVDVITLRDKYFVYLLVQSGLFPALVRVCILIHHHPPYYPKHRKYN